MVFATSETIKKYIQEISSKETEVIPFGIDTTVFKPTIVKHPWSDDSKILLYVKPLEKIYCADIVIDAFAVVKKKVTVANLKLLIVGDGSQAADLKEKVNALGLSASVKFTGKLKYSAIPEYHNMADIFINIPEYESFGVCVIEAMACEKPVIVSNQGGLKEIVDNTGCGLLVPVHNIGETAAAIEKLLNNESLGKEMGRKGRTIVTERYNWEDNLDKMMSFYNKFIKRDK